MNESGFAMSYLSEIILDGQERALSCGVQRHLSYELVSRKAFVCIGVRRCGKSTLLDQIMAALIGKGISRQSMLYVNFFDDRLDSQRHGQIGDVIETYFTLFPEKRGHEKVYCFLDEIQMVDNWEPFVERLLRAENCEVFLTGSSSRMLSKEIATQMRGRAATWELFPFSFREFLDRRDIPYERISSPVRSRIQQGFLEFWECGGFPEVTDMSARLRVMTHQEYFKTIVHRDVVERNDAAHPQAVLDLALRLINQVGSMYSVNALTGYVKSLGHKTTKTFVGECVEWLQDAYALFPVKIFHPSQSVQNANTRKIYCADHAMVRSVSSGILINAGHLLENLVFTHLRSITHRIHYYRTASGREVDFIWQRDGKEWQLVQVCETLVQPETRKREITALQEAMRELHIGEATIVTRDGDETVETADGVIHVTPAWRYLLKM